jgi:hypothetical protein
MEDRKIVRSSASAKTNSTGATPSRSATWSPSTSGAATVPDDAASGFSSPKKSARTTPFGPPFASFDGRSCGRGTDGRGTYSGSPWHHGPKNAEKPGSCFKYLDHHVCGRQSWTLLQWCLFRKNATNIDGAESRVVSQNIPDINLWQKRSPEDYHVTNI